ncbi:MAG: HAMP domain-containing sensor histidine kinase [Bacteroidales bacterium]
MYISILNNITLLVSLAVIYSFLNRYTGKNSLCYQLLSGILFGIVAIVGMMNSVAATEGIIFDGRSIVLVVAGMFGGPVTAGVSGVVSAVYRIYMGGVGTIMGVSVIAESAIIGTVVFYLRRRYGWASHLLFIYGTGVVVHLIMLMLTATLPAGSAREILPQIVLPVIVIYPLATLLIAVLFRSQESFLEAKRKAEESDRLKTAFLNNLSHEIRTPLNAIIGFSDMMVSENIPEEDKRNFKDIISRSSGQLLSMIDDILDIASIEAGEVTVKVKQTDINTLLDHMANQFRYQADRNSVIINVEYLPEGVGLKAVTDETKLMQILSNLTGNAVKFTREGSVTITCRDEGNHFLFCVRDTGTGIDSAAHEIIFERFRQASPEIASEYGGTGIGLSVAKSYVELLGGRIWLESEPGKGSEFFFTLPKNQAL